MKQSADWKASFNRARDAHDLDDPVYRDPVYTMLHDTTQNHHMRIALDYHAWVVMFRIMFGYFRPEL